MDARVHTKSFEFPRKLHNLGTLFQLGEGVDMDMALLGGFAFVIWFATLTALFGLPQKNTVFFYATVPIALVAVGFRPDPKRARRRRITGWVLRARYALVGHMPIVAGRREGGRADTLPARTRFETDRLASFLARRADARVWDSRGGAPSIPFERGRARRVNVRARLCGGDAMNRIRAKKRSASRV